MNTLDADFALVDADRVIELHAAAIALKGGSLGLRDRNLLLGAVGNALSAAIYSSDDGAPDVLQIAAHLLYYLTKAHPFIDGNKRAAWLACEEQLRLVGIKICAPTDDAEALVLDVTTGACVVPTVVDWISARLDVYEPSAENL